MTARQAVEQRKREIHDLMMSFVINEQTAHQMRWQYETIEKIVAGCSRLNLVGDTLIPEFPPGTGIKDACDIGWWIRTFTRLPVRFSFNGVNITMEAK